ncbi:MAG: ABC transporter permease [Actinobacteria bacterium]|nr:ABC transporter permease [Actinomycetota bacterium]MBO0784676.1 ABC transporter permease [Actinomycetota bacterium]
MARQIVRWLVSSVIMLFAITALTFVLASMAPGDAAKAILSSSSGSYTPQQYQQMRHALGIDQPLLVQYWHWLDGVVHGSLGTDLLSGQPVAQELNTRLSPSLSLIVGTVLVAGVIGVSLGVVSALRGGVLGRAVDALSLFGLAIPNFWLALALAELLAVKIQLFPATGYTPLNDSPAGWLRGITLPVLTLAAGAVAFIAKQTRDALADVMSREFVVMLRARGLPERSVVLRHALRNAAIPVVTLLGLLFVGLLGGTVLVEDVFSIPGLGQQAVTAAGSHDLPVIEGVAFYFTVIVVIVNLLVDLSYRLLNPKVRGS